MKNLLFSFEDLSTKDKAVKQAARYFSRAGANVVQQEVIPTVKRTSGISYREMALTFADSQRVLLRTGVVDIPGKDRRSGIPIESTLVETVA